MSVECPDCGGPVVYDLGCASFGSDSGGWLSCMSCDSAIDYTCARSIGDGSRGACSWTYTDGLNPGNPRAAGNAGRRPVWLEGHPLSGPYGVRALPGVPPLWDMPDEWQT